MTSAVIFHFDVMCPWAYQGSKWIREAAAVRGLSVEWRVFSLEEQNWQEGKKHPWERPWSYSWSLLRIAAYARREMGGNIAVDRYYAVAGRRYHEEGFPVHTRDGARATVAELGWDPDMVDAAVADPATTEIVRAEHQAATNRGAFGVPTLVVNDQVIFGPVLVEAPTGEAAGRLWDAVITWSETPGLYEMQRPKLAADRDLIDRAFARSYQARQAAS
jgi:2-hydroxychromene-2-carboxylate isomerase